MPGKFSLITLKDPQGVHAIEKIIASFDESYIRLYYDIILDNFMSLANNSYGLGVVKKIIIHARNTEVVNTTFLLLVYNALVLVQNPFGNYAIQMAIDVIYILISRSGVMISPSKSLTNSKIIFKSCLNRNTQVMFLKSALRSEEW